MALVIPNTPRSSVVKGKNGSYIRLNWDDRIKRFNGQYTRAQIWLDSEILKDTAPFVPMETGALMRSGRLGTKLGSGIIRYDAPYARYLYYGKAMAGRAPKRVTDKDLVFSQAVHPQAQAFWYQASEALNKQKWIKGARKIAGGG